MKRTDDPEFNKLLEKVEEGKGTLCACGRFHKFGAYVYAHWTTPLTLTCPDCATQYHVLEGKAEMIENEKGQPVS